MEWAEELLENGRIRRQGILNPQVVKELWEGFKKDGVAGVKIWYLLMFQEWMENHVAFSMIT